MVIWTQLIHFYLISIVLISLSKITIIQLYQFQFLIKLFSFITFLSKTFQVIPNTTSLYPIRTKGHLFVIPSSHISRQEWAISGMVTDWAHSKKTIKEMLSIPIHEGVLLNTFFNYNRSVLFAEKCFLPETLFNIKILHP